MLFPTVTFAVFFVIVFLVNWLTMPHRTVWRWSMLVASYVFYAWWDWRFVALIVTSQLGNQAFARSIASTSSRRRGRRTLVAAIAANLLLLGTFKYYGFFATSVVNGLDALGVEASLPLLRLILPIGISFFTFQAISYVVDVYRRDVKPVETLDFALYLAFFPQLVAGPIVRARELVPQFATPRDPRRVDASRGFYLIVIGLFKKVVIADVLARSVVDPVFGSPQLYSALDTVCAIYAFSVQIYCDFSGYTDIAIGVALLLGFVFPDNFASPYAATSARDFWRRWHMTLSRWLRDYVFIPFGGSREQRRARIYRNLMLTMLLGGLWHGADWNFVVWGGLHGAWLVAGRMWDARRRPELVAGRPVIAGGSRAPLATLLRRRIVTFHIVTALWIFFRAESMSHAGSVVERLGAGWDTPTRLVSVAVVLAIAFGIGVQYVSPIAIDRAQAAFSRLGAVRQGIVLAVCLFVIDALGPEGVAPFIYFQF